MRINSLRNLQPERIVVKPPRGFARFLLRAARLLKNPALLRQVLAQASSKLGRREGSGALREVKEQLLRLLALLKAYVAGDYRDVSTQTMVIVVAAIAYFVVPFDGVPDFLFGWGLVDDAAVITYVVAQISGELEAFARWQDAQREKAGSSDAPDNALNKDDNLPSDPSDDDDC